MTVRVEGTNHSDVLEERSGTGSTMLQISNAIVGLHKEFYGRGPTKARSILARDVLVVVLEGGFTQAERTLAESGRTEIVSDARHVMQSVIKERWIDAVEGLLGRRVTSFLSANDPVKQLQVETFLLEPAPHQTLEGPVVGELAAELAELADRAEAPEA